MRTARAGLAGLAAELGGARKPFVWATVVSAAAPTSAKPGDSALVLEDGRIEGFVGGTCAETTVRVQALEALASGRARIVRIVGDGPSQDWEPAAGEDEVTVANPCLSGGTLRIFLEPEVPEPLVLVFGDGPIARALVAAGSPTGAAGPSPESPFGLDVRAFADPAEMPSGGTAAVVVASHGRNEETVIARALEAGVPYVGLVASRRRGAAVLDAMGLDDSARERVRTPAGLDIGARTPGEVALSVLAEIVSLRRRQATPPGGGQSAGEDSPPAPPADAAATAVDPVCGMTVAAVAATLSAEHAGGRLWFCGPGCRDAFLDDPGRYLHGSPAEGQDAAGAR